VTATGKVVVATRQASVDLIGRRLEEGSL
jgi:hypothetical protein